MLMSLKRVLEPEVMDTIEEARDYDQMDHSAVNQLFVADMLAFIGEDERSCRCHESVRSHSDLVSVHIFKRVRGSNGSSKSNHYHLVQPNHCRLVSQLAANEPHSSFPGGFDGEKRVQRCRIPKDKPMRARESKQRSYPKQLHCRRSEPRTIRGRRW